MSNVTRIADLPNGKPEDFQNVMIKEQPTNYVPINVHPNPYGLSDKNPIQQEPPSNTQAETTYDAKCHKCHKCNNQCRK